MINCNDIVRFTPLFGGRENLGVCSLLEIGKCRILFDCGCVANCDAEQYRRAGEKLRADGGVDAILLSHADIQHMGALPILYKALNNTSTQVICTLPVFKMGQLMLYDYCLNKDMEGTALENLKFTLDDVDSSLQNVVTVKYRQSLSLQANSDVALCPHPCGRTIGGSTWLLTYKSISVMYIMDINLRKEIVIEGGTLDLPTSPSLLIVQGNTIGNTYETFKKRKGRDEGLISSILEVIRNDGNVLLPCESIARSFELIQLLAKAWNEHNLSLYHLIFLSPVASTILEFAKSQLEWMNNSLSAPFYNGYLNPFELHTLKVISTLHELDALSSTPRVVIATDASLTCGMAKELLIRWGGDKRCCVMFTDVAEAGSLAADIRSKVAPIIATVPRVELVELAGAELAAYLHTQEKQRRQQEAEDIRKRREAELTRVCIMKPYFITVGIWMTFLCIRLLKYSSFVYAYACVVNIGAGWRSR